MKKYLVILLALITVLKIPSVAECREDGTLYNDLSEKNVINVYVPGLTNSSVNREVDTKKIEKNIEDALAARMTLNFNVVNNTKDADIIVNGNVLECLWSDHDPVDNVYGLGAIAMDAAIRENYGRMQIYFEVSNAKNGKVLWNRKIQATITGNEITKENSVDMLSERVAKVFMRDCFAKPRKQRGPII